MINEIALIINNDLFFGLCYTLIALYYLTKQNNMKPALFIFIAAGLALALKPIVAKARPCAGLPGCVDELAGFPSAHTYASFMLALALRDKKETALFLAIALFIAYTRILLNQHSLADIAGTIGLAAITAHIVEVYVWKTLGK